MTLLCCQPVQAADTIVIRVGVYENAPKLMLGPDGQPSGVFGDLLQAIADKEGWTLVPVVCNWEGCLDLLANKQIDLMPDVAVSTSRQERFDFHKIPALHSWSQLFSRAGHGYYSPIELDKKRIAVLTQGIQVEYLEQLTSAFNIHPTMLPVNTPEDAFEQVRLGKADLAVSNHLFGNYQAHKYGLEPTAILFQPSQLYFATPRGDGANLLNRIDYWLQQWRADADSPYYHILNRWGSGVPKVLIPSVIMWAAVAVILLLLLAVVFIILLRYQVRVRTCELQTSELHLSDILSGVQAFIYDKDMELRYQYGNKPLCDFLGVDMVGLNGKTDLEFYDEDTAKRIRTLDREVLEQGKRVVTEQTVQSNHEPRPRTFITVAMPLRGADGKIKGLRAVSTDITEQQQQKEQIQQLSYFDPLTGLPNRRKIHERLTHAMARAFHTGNNGAILLIDLDDFHDLNDTHSHELGDRLLQAVAMRLSMLDIPSSLLARFGGDEFIVLLEDLGTDREAALTQIEEQLDRVLAAFNYQYDLGQITYSCAASIGVAMFYDVGNNPDGLIKGAELAMFGAKQSGKNGFSFYNQSMQVDAVLRAEIAEGIRQGILNREFELWYQPQFDADNQLVGMEALVRWRHPQKGIISPLEFIPVAESTGLILPLGEWILRTACEQLVIWCDHPLLGRARIAVNISARQIHDDNFVAKILDILQHTGAEAGRLELELTESLLVNGESETLTKMDELRTHGVRFSLDDFGTGYSSLLYLKRLPIYKLKIDQGFIHDLLTDPSDAAIVKTIIDLGQNMDLDIIAEGVETLDQRDALQAMGCQLYQGYLFSRPLPAAELVQWLAIRSAELQ